MEGYIDENRWIDLSGLPRTKHGKYIDWKKSIGMEIPFQFDNVKSKIKLIRHGDKDKIFITIDNYANDPVKIGTNWLTSCLLYRLVGNKVADMRPDIAKYFVNPLDTYRYSVYSKASVEVICPICGRKRKQYVNNLCTKGFYCDVCYDGISIPNKIMYSVLEQCNIEFMNEISHAKGFAWIKKRYRYDFYFKHQNGENIIIEMDGGLHRTDKQKNNDHKKDVLANTNGFKVIRIDCDYIGDALTYIKSNILNSELSELLPLHKVNWGVCAKMLQTSLMRDACRLWETYEYSVGEIAKQLNVSRVTITTYLKRGVECGLCPSYNTCESTYRAGTRVALLQNDNIIHVFRHFQQLCEQSLPLLGTSFSKPSVITCSRRNQLYKGYTIKRITKEEYEQYKMIENNNTNKEAM